MAISSKILSQVPVEDEFSSASSRHILVEDGGKALKVMNGEWAVATV